MSKRWKFLGMIEPRSRLLAVAIVIIEGGFLGSVWALPDKHEFAAWMVSAGIFFVALVGIVRIELVALRTSGGQGNFGGSARTPDSPLLSEIVRGAVQTVCQGVTVPKTPEEAQLRALIYKREGKRLVCTHFWAPESLQVKEQVGDSFALDHKAADDIVVVRAYFDEKPTRTAVEPLADGTIDVQGDLSESSSFSPRRSSTRMAPCGGSSTSTPTTRSASSF